MCEPPCYVHQYLRLKLTNRKTCKCQREVIDQELDRHYFTHLINAQEIIEAMKNFKPDGKDVG